MSDNPVYEIVKIQKNKVFIIGLSYPWISQGLETAYNELKELFPNKTIIFTDGLNQKNTYWYEMIMKFYRGSHNISFAEYNEEIPDIKPWDKMLRKSDN